MACCFLTCPTIYCRQSCVGDGHFIFACQRALALYQTIKKAMNETVHPVMSLAQPKISQAHSMVSLVYSTMLPGQPADDTSEYVYASIDDLSDSACKHAYDPLNDVPLRHSRQIQDLTPPNPSSAQTNMDKEDSSPNYAQVLRHKDRVKKPDV